MEWMVQELEIRLGEEDLSVLLLESSDFVFESLYGVFNYKPVIQ